MLWDSTAPGAVIAAIQQITKAARQDYESLVRETLCFREGDQRGPMIGSVRTTKQFDVNGNPTRVSQGDSGSYLKKYMDISWADGASELLPVFVPLITRFCELQGTLFHRPPTLRPKIAGQDAPASEAAKVASLLKTVRFNHRGKSAQQKAMAVKVVFAVPRFFRGRDYLDIVDPCDLYVEEDPLNPGVFADALAIAHRLPETADGIELTATKWLVWTREPQLNGPDQWRVYYCDHAGRQIPNPYYPDDINPYGRYPHVPLYAADSERIFPVLDDTLLNAQVAVNLAWTHIVSLIRRAGGTPFFAGFFASGDKPLEMIMGENHPVIANDPAAKFEWVELKADLNQIIGATTQYMKLQAGMRGIPTESMDIEAARAIDALSAASKAMDRLDLMEVRQDQEALWADQIQELWQSILTVHNTHATPANQIDPNIELEVVWSQPELPVNRNEQAQAAQIEIGLGISSAIDIIMARDKCSRAEAEVTFRANLALRDEAKQAEPAPAKPETQTDDTEDSEDHEEDDGRDDNQMA